ncbi:helix-turn-helix domain-containing protein [Paenibacillus pini]|uniref:Transcriptional regulator n=1 Tax=Paenibacillus pini JCM 16418 TaxID=1236976 RepID=W7Z8W3_9BACL|nr:hypothetical protein [Paenibacillus pini]GAF10909.1 hypothetical protein JCM16418_5144 [Paenibacillus pini JCM 16418]
MSIRGLGIGKPRTRLGKFLDNNGLTQSWLEQKTGISNPTMVKLCGDKSYSPYENTKIKIIKVLRKELDEYIDVNDFW